MTPVQEKGRAPSALRFLRLANPVVRALLRSPLHRLLSGSLAVLAYEGHRSQRTFAIPVLYAETIHGYVLLAARPERKRWWRTFREPAAANLLVRGAWQPVEGRLLEGTEREVAVAAYVARFPRVRRQLGIDSGGDTTPAAIVAFAHREGSGTRSDPGSRRGA